MYNGALDDAINYYTQVSFAYLSGELVTPSSMYDKTVLQEALQSPPQYLIIRGYVPSTEYLVLDRSDWFVAGHEAELLLSVWLEDEQIAELLRSRQWELILIADTVLAWPRAFVLIFEHRKDSVFRVGIARISLDWSIFESYDLQEGIRSEDSGFQDLFGPYTSLDTPVDLKPLPMYLSELMPNLEIRETETY